MKKIALCLLLPLFAQVLAAQEAEAYAGIESSPGLVLQATTSPAVKLIFNWNFTIPFLQGDSPFTQGNNIRITPGLEITPVNFNLTANAVWTPIAFAEIVASGMIGSGWSMAFFGSELHGIGLNLPGYDGNAVHDGSAFDGVFGEALFGAAIQGDVAAVFPGPWNHLVFRSFHGVSFAAYSRARSGQAWFFENDEGENRNGFSYRGNLLIGYQMPIFLNMVAVMAEAERFLTTMPGGSQWGDDMLRWTFSGVLSFAVAEGFEVALVTQFWTRRNFVPSVGTQPYLHFTNRTLDTSMSRLRRLEFYRLVLALTYRL